MACLQDVNNPEATGAIIAAGAASAVRAMLEQNMRMHVLLLAITPRGERCAACLHVCNSFPLGNILLDTLLDYARHEAWFRVLMRKGGRNCHRRTRLGHAQKMPCQNVTMPTICIGW